MSRAWSAISDPNIAITLIVVDFPRADRCDDSDWVCAKEAAICVRQDTGRPVAMISTLSELMPEDVSAELAANGVVTLNGLNEGLEALVAALPRQEQATSSVLQSQLLGTPELVDEAMAKTELAKFGLVVPRQVTTQHAADVADRVAELRFPVAVKAMGSAHKTENGAIALDCASAETVQAAALKMTGAASGFLIEEMAPSGVELIVGILRDPAHGFVLTVGLGGVLTEVMHDVQSMLVPASRTDLKQALLRLKSAKLMLGYRGSEAVDFEAVLDAITSIQSYVVANAARVEEVEINPLICSAQGAIAVDALIREVP